MLTELALVSFVPLLVASFNAVTWRRLAPSSSRLPVSVLIPARNEERNIAQAIGAALASVDRDGSPNVKEVIVYDDDSTDDTRAIVNAFCERDLRVKLLPGGDLPAGWTGKTHACHRLGEIAKGEVLLFVDADVQLGPLGVSAVAGCFEETPPVEFLTAVPRQLTATLAERSIVSFLLVTYLSWLPLRLIETSRDARFVAANGQLAAMRREAWERLGGLTSVREALVEDVALAKHAKKLGLRVAFGDATGIATCRMYHSAREVWRGFSKNIAPGLGGSFLAVAAVTGLYGLCFVWPYATLLLGMVAADSRALLYGLMGVFANVALRVLTVTRYRQPLGQVILHPISALVVMILAWNSWLWTARRRIHWAGRTYSGTRSS